jgi:hypothetical protein
MPFSVEAGLLSAALIGYQKKLQEIDARAAELRRRLGRSSHAFAPPATVPRR